MEHPRYDRPGGSHDLRHMVWPSVLVLLMIGAALSLVLVVLTQAG